MLANKLLACNKMSSSISLSSFGELDTQTSKSFPLQGLRVAKFNQSFRKTKQTFAMERRQEDFLDEDFQLPLWAQQSAIYQTQLSTQRLSQAASARDEQEKRSQFFEEIDERISRNSLEYPEEQARYVRNWLDGTNANDDEEDAHLGRVIGIRGFQSENDEFRRSEERKLRSSFIRLKSDFLKLQSENDKMRLSWQDLMAKMRKILRKKNYDIDVLKTLLIKRTETDEPNKDVREDTERVQSCGYQLELDNLKNQIRQLELAARTKDKQQGDLIEGLRSENELLKHEADEKRQNLEEEVALLRAQMKKFLSSEPGEVGLLELRKENSRLKTINQLDASEFGLLRESYERLESQLKSVLSDQMNLDAEKNDEIKNVLTELCRLQVYQPKLEHILEVEREVKRELEQSIGSLEKENEQLKEAARLQKAELSSERMRTRKNESLEIERLVAEVQSLQEKCHSMRMEKCDLEEALRVSKVKLSHLDVRFSSDFELAKEEMEKDKERLRCDLMKAQEELRKVNGKFELAERRLVECERDKQQLQCQVVELERKLELAKESGALEEIKVSQLKEKAAQVGNLCDQLKSCEGKKGELFDENETLRRHLERASQQVEQLQLRYQHQQSAYDELKARKDKELAQLRTNLNLEQYNRQVALKGIERELRVSLRELEAMKYRFSQRLAQSNSSSSGNCSARQPSKLKLASSGSNSNGSSSSPATKHFARPPLLEPSCCVGAQRPSAKR